VPGEGYCPLVAENTAMAESWKKCSLDGRGAVSGLGTKVEKYDKLYKYF
jgi:hypothetical protein